MNRAENAAWEAYPDDRFVDAEYSSMCRDFYQEGYEQAEKDIISIIESRISEIMGDAQPAPVLRAELRELINKIEQK